MIICYTQETAEWVEGKSSFYMKQYKTTYENLLLETSIAMPVSGPKFLSSLVLLRVSHKTTCHHHASINGPRQRSLCSTSQLHNCFSQAPVSTFLALELWIWILYQLLIGTAITSTLIFPCILTRFHVKHLETIITACPINLHSNLPLWQSCH